MSGRGLHRTAGPQHLDDINKILYELRERHIVPGLLEVQNIEAMASGNTDALGEIMSYIDGTHRRRQWDFVILDPLDSILPLDRERKAATSTPGRRRSLIAYSTTLAALTATGGY